MSSHTESFYQQDAAEFPFDPPITAEGVQQAKRLADDLKRQLVSLDVIISSPYLRCLQTAEILAEEFDVLVLLDGEVLGPAAFESQPTGRRPLAQLGSVCRRGRIKAGRTLGKEPQWPETLNNARIRRGHLYAKRFLDYLKRSRHTKKSCILVTHGHMLQTCASVLPATQHLKVTGVDYVAALVATCRKNDDAEAEDCLRGRYMPSFKRAVSLDSAVKDEVPESTESNESESGSGMLQMQNALLHDARITYWSVWLQGFRTSSSSGASTMVRELQSREDPMGMSWQDMVQLLGLLPTAPSQREESEDRSSFLTDPRTMSSMAHFRDPTGGGRSPQQGEVCMRWSPPSEIAAPAPPPPPKAASAKAAPALNLGLSKLASRWRWRVLGMADLGGEIMGFDWFFSMDSGGFWWIRVESGGFWWLWSGLVQLFN
eukprot:Skav222455  [mRNA]  locus=scaffold3319:96817:99986:+ [translate_table: standard]